MTEQIPDEELNLKNLTDRTMAHYGMAGPILEPSAEKPEPTEGEILDPKSLAKEIKDPQKFGELPGASAEDIAELPTEPPKP